MTTTTKVHFVTRYRRKCLTRREEVKQPLQRARIPRVAKLMALAIRFDQLLRDGTVRDMSELARLAHVTQPRMTQIMNMLHLAPDIQEQILFLGPTKLGDDPTHERAIRPICAERQWSRQRLLLVNPPGVSTP